MRLLAVITARGGSKRLPGKNIRPLSGRPLIVWTIDAVRGQPAICDVLVSTDDEMIANVASLAGVLVPWLRPAILSGDTVSSVDVALHALDWYEGVHGPVDGLLLLQPTSPFRLSETIEKGLTNFSKAPHRPVVSVSPAASHPFWCCQIEGTSMKAIVAGGNSTRRSQDLPVVYVLNGAIYLIRPQDLRNARTFKPENAQPLVIDSPWEGLDIDTPWDWFLAEHIAANLEQLKSGLIPKIKDSC